MSAAPGATPVDLAATICWPVRANIDPFTCDLLHKGLAHASLSYQAVYPVAGTVVLSGMAWTRVDFRWSKPFIGGSATADAWASNAKGAELLLGRAEELSAVLIDALRATYPKDRNLAGLRNFGIRDWPFYEYGVVGGVTHTKIGVHAESQFRTVGTQIFAGAPVTVIGSSSSFPARALLRATDLAESGYPTEAALIAFGALDVAVQDFLINALKGKGVSESAAKDMLRNITTKRLTTYLDGVLKLACGHTLVSDAALFERLKKANLARNDAIHNGVELSRNEAVEIIRCIVSVFRFLQAIDRSFEPYVVDPEFFG